MLARVAAVVMRTTLVMTGATLRNGGRSSGSFGARMNCGDRETAPIEDIWREKIGGCSYREGNTALMAPETGAV
jgi:hypothetical protein